MLHQRSILFSSSLLTIAAVAAVGLVVAWQAQAGPISGGSGNAPFTKLAVYQGLLTVVPSTGSDLLEIGNAGRDIAGTSDIYLRPGSLTSGANAYFRIYKNAQNVASATIPGELTVGNENTPGVTLYVHSGGAVDGTFRGMTVGNDSGERVRIGYMNDITGTTNVSDILTWGPGSGGGDVFGSLAIGSRGNLPSGITLYTSPGSGLLPRVRVSNAGDLNIISGRLCFGNLLTDCRNTWTGLGGGSQNLDSVLGVGNASTKSAFLGIDPAPVGSLDTFGTYANSAGSAIYAEQLGTSATSWAGYFSGSVNITEGLTVGSNIILNTVSKNEWKIQVCGVNGGACLGQYITTTGTTRDISPVATGYQYVYNTGITTASVYIYGSNPTCPAGTTPFTRCSGVATPSPDCNGPGVSYYEALSCTPFFSEFVLGSHPYGTVAQTVCRSNNGSSHTATRSKSSAACNTINVTNNFFHAITAQDTNIQPQYELR